MAKTIAIDPVTRLEGHLAIEIDVENGVVASARCLGEMFRGFEQILRGRDPLDAQEIVQRICGVCPVSHGTASILAQDMAYGITPATNGRIVRNLILGANYIQSHIIHFYQLSALDFVDIAAILSYEGTDPVLQDLKAWAKSQLQTKSSFPLAPFLPRYEGRYIQDADANIMGIRHYLEALEMRKLAHQIAALFAGKMPHPASLIPGGVTESVDATKIAAYASGLKKLQTFINRCYLPDVEALAGAFPEYFSLGRGSNNFLSYGVFPETDDNKRYLPAGVLMGSSPVAALDINLITESVEHSFFSSPSGLNPAQGQTTADPKKAGAYTWLKAPRYNRQVMEVGPLARMLVAYNSDTCPAVKSTMDTYLKKLGKSVKDLNSAMGRHLARAIECKLLADQIDEWLVQLKPGVSCFKDFKLPQSAKGVGLMEAPRGALGHWIEIKNSKISNYQCVVPTTWNCSPRDEYGVPGCVEQSLENTPIADDKNPIEAARIVRSFDPCLACAIH